MEATSMMFFFLSDYQYDVTKLDLRGNHVLIFAFVSCVSRAGGLF